MRQQRIVIVGAGIIGLATAYALLSQGMQQVVVLEQEAVDHRRSTSHGFSRLLRFEYGKDRFYPEMVGLSLSRWKRLEWLTQRTLYTRTGLLVLGKESDCFTRSSYHTMSELHLPSEKLSRQQCMQRFPQFSLDTVDMYTYNVEAGILHASTCLQTLKNLILDLGGIIEESCRVTRITRDSASRPLRLTCSSGSEILADRVVLATGPWVHRLLGDLRLPVTLTRQHLLYFAGLSYSYYGVHTFPAFIMHDFYGFPVQDCHGSGWLKAASHTFGTSIDPDDMLPPDEYIIARTARRLRELIPGLQQAELARVDSCMYDVTPDEDFILDHHPADLRIVFATGLTGHGFKFGLLLGELMSSLLYDTEPPVSMERFQLARFSRVHQESSVA